MNGHALRCHAIVRIGSLYSGPKRLRRPAAERITMINVRVSRRSTRASLLAVAIVLLGVAARPVAAPTFKSEKSDIKGEGGTDYVTADAATGRVFVSRSTHMMVVDGATGKVVGDIPDLPGVHGAGLAPKAGHGFTTNGGDQTVTMFDLKTLAVIKKIKVSNGGLDGIMYDETD